LTDGTGAQTRYYDFSSIWPAAQWGQFASYTDRAGNVTQVMAHTATGQIAAVQRSMTDGTTRVMEGWLYSYLPATDPNGGLLRSVREERDTDGGPFPTVRSVQYSYYDGREAYGNRGDLKTATVLDSNGAVLGTSYYRYYTPNDPNGYQHGLKYVFN